MSSLTDLLSMEELDSNLFRSRTHCANFKNTLFGGQVLAQALASAFNTVDKILPHSLHAYFLQAGSSESPVIYGVENVRDGGSFSSRRIVAWQAGKPIFNMSASFHSNESGFEHQMAFPSDVAMPDEILARNRGKSGIELDAHIPGSKNKSTGKESPFELLAVEPELFHSKDKQTPEALFWIRAQKPLPDDPIYHCCALAFASDFGLLATTLLPHPMTLFAENICAASIDHAMWFHRQNFRVDEWMLYRTYSPWAGGGRGLSHGSIFTMDGTLVATTSQEGLIRSI